MASGRKFHHFIIDFWTPEGATFIASFLCFAALVALLAFMMGRKSSPGTKSLSTRGCPFSLQRARPPWPWLLQSQQVNGNGSILRIKGIAWSTLKTLTVPVVGRGGAFYCFGIVGEREIILPILTFSAYTSRVILRIDAITTVIAIAIDPFSQLLIGYVKRVDYVASSEATISSARSYSRGQVITVEAMPVEMGPGKYNAI